MSAASGRAAGDQTDHAARVADALDALVRWVGQVAAGLFLVLTAAIVVHVILRYACGISLVWLEELHWQLYAFLITLSLAMAW